MMSSVTPSTRFNTGFRHSALESLLISNDVYPFQNEQVLTLSGSPTLPALASLELELVHFAFEPAFEAYLAGAETGGVQVVRPD